MHTILRNIKHEILLSILNQDSRRVVKTSKKKSIMLNIQHRLIVVWLFFFSLLLFSHYNFSLGYCSFKLVTSSSAKHCDTSIHIFFPKWNLKTSKTILLFLSALKGLLLISKTNWKLLMFLWDNKRQGSHNSHVVLWWVVFLHWMKCPSSAFWFSWSVAINIWLQTKVLSTPH